MAYEELIARLNVAGNPICWEAAAALREMAGEMEALRNDLDFCTEDLHEKFKADLEREGDHYRALLAEAEKDADRYRWLRGSDDAEVHLLDYNEDGSTDAWYDHCTEALDAEIDQRIDAAMEPK